jgi:hypothetical protein
MCLESENYSLVPTLLIWAKVVLFPGKILMNLWKTFCSLWRKETNLNNRKKILLICANFGKVSETWIKIHSRFPGIILVHAGVSPGVKS